MLSKWRRWWSSSGDGSGDNNDNVIQSQEEEEGYRDHHEETPLVANHGRTDTAATNTNHSDALSLSAVDRTPKIGHHDLGHHHHHHHHHVHRNNNQGTAPPPPLSHVVARHFHHDYNGIIRGDADDDDDYDYDDEQSWESESRWRRHRGHRGNRARARAGGGDGDDGDDSPGSQISRDGSLASLASSVRSSLVESVHYVVDRSLALAGKPCNVRDVGGTATVPNEIFNLVKNLVGAGALGLPSGIAAYGNAPSALIPASFIIIIMGAIFAYYFLLMGRICKITRTATYREAWEITVGESHSALVAFTSTLMAGLGNLAYSMILADTTRSLLHAAGFAAVTRTASLIGITVLVLLPLCLMKNLTILAPFSFVGSAGMVFSVVAMAWRYYDGTYDVDRGGKYLKDLPANLQPSFGTTGAGGALSADALLLVCMTFQAFFAHYNAPRYYIELKQNTVTRFGTVVSTSFGISALIYIAMSAFGFLTFGSNCDGFILNNYSNQDDLASLCRFAIAISLAFTYPLPFIGVRDGILDLIELPPQRQTSSNLNVLTVVLLVLFTVLAMFFENLGLVNAVGGGILGTAVVFIFPALMYQSYVKNVDVSTRRDRREARFAIILMYVGIAMGGLGVWVALTGR